MVKTKKDLQPGFRQQRQEARAQAQYEAAPPQPSIQDQILQLLMADPNAMTPKVSRVRSPGTLMRSNGEAAAKDANAEAEGAAEPGDGPAEDKAESVDPALIAQIAGQGQKLQNASVAPSDDNLQAVSGVDPTQMNALLQGFMALPPEAQQRLLAAMSGVGGQIQPAQAPADAAPADAVLQKVLGQR